MHGLLNVKIIIYVSEGRGWGIVVSGPLCQILRYAANSILTCVQFVPCIQGSVRIWASVVCLWTSNIVKTSNYRVTTLCRNQQRGEIKTAIPYKRVSK